MNFVTEELMKNLLLSSDPLISSFRKAHPYPYYPNTKVNETLNQLLQNIENGENDDDYDDDDGDINGSTSGI